MSGIFQKITPTCRYGHGELTLQAGDWSFIGGKVQQPTDQEDLKTSTLLTAKPAFVKNNDAFTVTVYACGTCGYIELFDR